MLRVRVIPILSLRRRGLVKTVRFRRPKYVGDPINVVRIFNQKEVDEIILTEIVAAKEGRGPDFELLEQLASEAFMPICYGGGVRSVSDAKRILRLGMEKIALNSASLERPELVRELADSLGSQCVVASVDIRRTWRGIYEVHSHSRRAVPERDPLRWTERLIRMGAGEILVNAVDRDGTMRGSDVELLTRFRGRFDVPVIACGGVGSVADMRAAVRAGGLSAVGVGARFIYEGPYRAVLVSYLSRDEMATVQGAAE